MLQRLNDRQRVVLVVALGITLYLVAVVVVMWWRIEDTGWFAYAPNTGVLGDSMDPKRRVVVEALIYGAALLLWTLGALRILRSSTGPDPTSD